MKTKRLVDLVKVPVVPNQRQALEVLDNWDFTKEAKKVRYNLIELGHDPTDTFIARGIGALRRYHAIALLDPLNGHAISDILDSFWHTQILFTNPYARFCDAVLGHFMHHYPLDHDDLRAVRGVRSLYDYTIEVHNKLFGEDAEFYPALIADRQLVCLHAKDCVDRWPGENRFIERPDLAVALKMAV